MLDESTVIQIGCEQQCRAAAGRGKKPALPTELSVGPSKRKAKQNQQKLLSLRSTAMTPHVEVQRTNTYSS